MKDFAESSDVFYKIVLVGAGSFLLAVMLLAVGLLTAPIYALAIPVGIVFAGVIVLNPFLGILFIAFFTQLDAILNLIFQAIPVSGVKIVTFLTLIGVFYNNAKESRLHRWGQDDIVFRFAILFSIALLISFLFVEDIAQGLWSLRRYVSLILLLYLVLRVVKSEAHIRTIFVAIIASTLISSLIVLMDWFMGGGHMVSSDVAATTAQFGDVSRSAGASDYNPTTSATMMLAGVTLALFLFIRQSEWRWLTGSTVLIGSMGLTLSFARSAAIVYAIALVWLLVKHRKHQFFPLIILAMVVVFISILPFIPAEYWDRLATLVNSSADSSLGRRLTYHLIGLDLFIHSPIVGVGPGNFPIHYTDMDYRWLPGRELIPRQLHNTYFEVLVETGLLGASCLYLMIGMALKNIYTSYRNHVDTRLGMYAEAIHYSFVSFLLVSVFMPNEYNKYFWLFTGITAIISRLCRQQTLQDKKLKSLTKN